MSIGLVEIGIVVAVCLFTAGLTSAGVVVWSRTRGPKPASDNVAIRFHRGRVVEADRDFLQILTHRGWDGHPETLREFLAFRFRGLPTRLFAGTDDFTENYPARDKADTTVLWLSRKQDGTTVALRDSKGPVDMEDHAMRYRRHTHWLAQWVSRSSPNPVWVTDPEGLVLWANRAYGDLARDRGYAELGEVSLLDDLDPERGFADREQRRYHLVFKDGRPDRWMDVTETIEQGMHLYHAVDVTAVVQGEAAQHTFVQTLTKTFAQLSIGLAIFDRSRQLALFNPALIDLTGLSAEYLSGRPECLTFFDSLREGGIMPEPRNYQTWRKKISDLILDAENDRYQETWSLATGNTYRITGRRIPMGRWPF